MTYREFKTMSPKAIAEAIFNNSGGDCWYDYVTALRGPDLSNGLSLLKMLFTAFLRGFVPQAFSIHDWEYRISSVGYFHAHTLVFLVRENNCSHYLSHIREALYALQTVMDSQIPAVLLTIAQTLEDGNVKEVSQGLDRIRELLKEDA